MYKLQTKSHIREKNISVNEKKIDHLNFFLFEVEKNFFEGQKIKYFYEGKTFFDGKKNISMREKKICIQIFFGLTLLGHRIKQIYVINYLNLLTTLFSIEIRE